MAAKTQEDVRETLDKPKPPNTPIGIKSWCKNEADGLRNHTDWSTARMDVQKNNNNSKTTKNVGRKVRTQLRPRTQNSPLELEIEMDKRTKGRKHVSIDGNDMHTPRYTPIKAQDTRNRKIAFGKWLR